MLDADYTQLTRENMAFGYDFVKSAKLLIYVMRQEIKSMAAYLSAITRCHAYQEVNDEIIARF